MIFSLLFNDDCAVLDQSNMGGLTYGAYGATTALTVIGLCTLLTTILDAMEPKLIRR